MPKVSMSPPVGEEFRAQHGAHAGQTLDYLGVLVLAKPALDGGFELGVLLIEGHHLLS